MVLHTFLWPILVVWVYMSLWFLVARQVNRADLVDSAWSIGFIVVAWVAWALNGREQGIRMLAAEFVSLWGARLFLHIFLRNRHKAEDHRYATFREKWGRHFWAKAYLNIFLLQGLLLLGVSCATIAVMTAKTSPILWLCIVGFALWIFGIVFEAEADAELAKFIKTKRPGQILQAGLWRNSRHPNYFGEICAWWGAALVAMSLHAWWGVIGAVIITLLITKISGIPPLEKHYADNPSFQKYKRRTSVLIPLPQRRA